MLVCGSHVRPCACVQGHRRRDPPTD